MTEPHQLTEPYARSAPHVELDAVTKRYALGAEVITALHDVRLTVNRGERIAMTGPSGSGKSTMMNIIGCLDTPTSGEYRLAGSAVAAKSPDELAHIRNQQIGFVFQSFFLLPRQTALENVMLPLIYREPSMPMAERRERAKAALTEVHLADRMEHRPNELSGGQKQRVAIARALVTAPELLLADEPTGNLDSKTGAEILTLLETTAAAHGMTLMIVTHDPEVARRCPREIAMRDGVIVEDRAHS